MYYLGVDIGGTKCAVSIGKIYNDDIDLVEKKEVPTKSNPYSTLDELAVFVEEWISHYEVKCAGISCGGPLDPKRGVILSPPNLSKEWYGFEIVSYIKSKFGINAVLENDANASAIAEWKFGAGKDAQNMIFMTFGTGLGAGLILNGKLYSGTNGNAGEVGHLRLENDGPIGYNKSGSAEGFCSGGGIAQLARLRAEKHGITFDHYLTTKEIFERTRQGDEFCTSIVRESAEKFARVLSFLIDLFNPEVIIIGGVFMRNYDLLMPIVTPIVERESLPASNAVCRILPAMTGERIGDYAALALAAMEDQK